MPRFAGLAGAVYAESGAPAAFTNEATTASGGYTVYTITDANKRYWTSDTVTVRKNGVIQTSGFTVERVGGRVIFSSPLQPSDTVTVSGYYLSVAEVAGFYSWSLDVSAGPLEATDFASGGWKQAEAGPLEAKLTAEWFWADERFLSAVGSELIVVAYVDETGARRYEGRAVVSSAAPEVEPGAVVKETIEFTFGKEFYYRG